MKPTPRMRAAMQELANAFLDEMPDQAPNFNITMVGQYRLKYKDEPDDEENYRRDELMLAFRALVIVDGRQPTDEEFENGSLY